MKHFIFRYKLSGVKHGPLQRGLEEKARQGKKILPSSFLRRKRAYSGVASLPGYSFLS